MTVSETDDVSGTNRDSDCIANRNKDKISARRKGTSGDSSRSTKFQHLTLYRKLSTFLAMTTFYH